LFFLEFFFFFFTGLVVVTLVHLASLTHSLTTLLYFLLSLSLSSDILLATVTNRVCTVNPVDEEQLISAQQKQ
jgi:hypothetical protein